MSSRPLPRAAETWRHISREVMVAIAALETASILAAPPAGIEPSVGDPDLAALLDPHAKALIELWQSRLAIDGMDVVTARREAFENYAKLHRFAA